LHFLSAKTLLQKQANAQVDSLLGDPFV
jgi:hypothetical protein